VCNYRLAMTQPSGDFVLALIFGYTRLMWETKKALYTRVLRRYPVASKQSVRVRALSILHECALSSSLQVRVLWAALSGLIAIEAVIASSNSVSSIVSIPPDIL
jgi:hypothetical protein